MPIGATIGSDQLIPYGTSLTKVVDDHPDKPGAKVVIAACLVRLI